MSWWELRMWIEMLNEEFADPEEEPVEEVHTDLAALGLTATVID